MPTMLREYHCLSCTWRVDVLEHRGERIALAPPGCEDEPFTGTCRQCGSPAMHRQVSVPHPVGLGDVGGQGRLYPYYDRGLQTQVNSRQHRSQICKARGAVPVDGTIDLERDASQRATVEEQARQDYRELQTMYEEHPDFRGYREARDKGALGDTLRMQQPWRQKNQMPRSM